MVFIIGNKVVPGTRYKTIEIRVIEIRFELYVKSGYRAPYDILLCKSSKDQYDYIICQVFMYQVPGNTIRTMSSGNVYVYE